MKRKNKYDTVKIPSGLTKKIDTIIEKSDGDFTSRTDVVKHAIRILYKEENE